MIIVTGGAGFIGSRLIHGLNARGITDILVVDHLGKNDKYKNLIGLVYNDYLDRQEFIEALDGEQIESEIEAIFHLGACSATTELDAAFLMDNNYRYSQLLSRYAAENQIRFIYASSAATYGDGDEGYSDQGDLLKYKPLNPYGFSKYAFDLWAEAQGYLEEQVGLKFFNVYGPNERHKGDMRSVISKSYDQIVQSGQVRLFKSHKEGFKDGEQLRDFVYVADVVEVMLYFMDQPDLGGIYNLGTGEARSFKDLVLATFSAMGKPAHIEYFDMPEHLRGRYQYFTQADMSKLKATGYKKSFTRLEDGVKDYVQNYLAKGN
ncbi:MAG: ADP-glyceromanno-heptose 6-epimerase [Candidatus Lambdaproteobacteria bacterium RIFOXYD2_FULL_50_16]|uniref:ADP-L-glycero-D-manno-heptose-6-epimerase n=1 Tax=Candidatus Lambdaproteobacteria bacterium RIFOXYD2_FULL_50_16 TaxID=1817772 RepID=A0A1F6GG48_9PROT|nr:MAG: ADP-glyceromanno-heptose 6-epimerase [Candidatus Lambdaproteobacteria bacterium RIFOXYD2_FULL_50_16]